MALCSPGTGAKAKRLTTGIDPAPCDRNVAERMLKNDRKDMKRCWSLQLGIPNGNATKDINAQESHRSRIEKGLKHL